MHPEIDVPRAYRSIVSLLLFIVCTSQIQACIEPAVIDPTDPFENAGTYPFQQTPLAFSNPEDISETLFATLYLPEASETEMVPLVIVLPGFGASHSAYHAYSSHFASHGIAVLGYTPTGNSDSPFDGQHDYLANQVSYALDDLLSNTSIAQQLDVTRIGLMGHSLGGKLAFYASALDSRFTVIVALDPVNSGGAPCSLEPNWCSAYPVAPNPQKEQIGILNDVHTASLIFRSAPDAVNPDLEFNAEFFFYGSDGLGSNAVAAPAAYIDMGSTPHSAYVPGPLAGLTEPLVKRTVIAWLKRHFFAEDIDDYLTGARMINSINKGHVVSVTERK